MIDWTKRCPWCACAVKPDPQQSDPRCYCGRAPNKEGNA